MNANNESEARVRQQMLEKERTRLWCNLMVAHLQRVGGNANPAAIDKDLVQPAVDLFNEKFGCHND